MTVTRLWYNDAEGGTNGATPTVTDTGSGHPHSAISIGAGNTAVYSTTAPLLGTKSIVATQASANQLIFGVSSTDVDSVEWTSAKDWFCVDFYFKASAAPAVTTTIFRGYTDAGYATQAFSVSYTTTRRITISDTVGGTSVSTPTGIEALTAGQPYLIRIASNKVAKTIEVLVYQVGSPDVYTQATLTNTVQTSIASCRYGITTASANFTLTSEVRLSSGGFLPRLDLTYPMPTVTLGPDVVGIEPYSNVILTVNYTGNISFFNIWISQGPEDLGWGPDDEGLPTRAYIAPAHIEEVTYGFTVYCVDDQGNSADAQVYHTVLPVDRAIYVDGELVPHDETNA